MEGQGDGTARHGGTAWDGRTAGHLAILTAPGYMANWNTSSEELVKQGKTSGMKYYRRAYIKRECRPEVCNIGGLSLKIQLQRGGLILLIP
jgi:hypothetical protein